MKAKSSQHVLERRANLLSQKMTSRISDLKLSLSAAQGRVPFHTVLAKSDALKWWSQHRYDDLGQKALAGLQPEAVMNLDAALAQYTQQHNEMGMPVETSPTNDIGAALAQQQGS